MDKLDRIAWNMWGVEPAMPGRVRVVQGDLRPPLGLTPEQVLNLITWLSMMSALSDEEILAARRALERAPVGPVPWRTEPPLPPEPPTPG